MMIKLLRNTTSNVLFIFLSCLISIGAYAQDLTFIHAMTKPHADLAATIAMLTEDINEETEQQLLQLITITDTSQTTECGDEQPDGIFSSLWNKKKIKATLLAIPVPSAPPVSESVLAQHKEKTRRAYSREDFNQKVTERKEHMGLAASTCSKEEAFAALSPLQKELFAAIAKRQERLKELGMESTDSAESQAQKQWSEDKEALQSLFAFAEPSSAEETDYPDADDSNQGMHSNYSLPQFAHICAVQFLEQMFNQLYLPSLTTTEQES